MDVAPDHQVVTVEGQTFSVDYDDDLPGSYHFKWLSGLSPGYGFGLRVSDHARQPQAVLLDAIKDFLAQIDPETGYIPD